MGPRFTVSVLADAHLGEGEVVISGQDSGSVSLGHATNVGITSGPVEEQP